MPKSFSTIDDRWEKIQWLINRHLEFWSGPLCNDLWLSTI